MNNNIKDIIAQSGLVIIDDGVYGRRWYKSTCGLDVDEVENLSKLIIVSVLNQVDEFLRLDGSLKNIGIDPEINIVAVIKRNFGIE